MMATVVGVATPATAVGVAEAEEEITAREVGGQNTARATPGGTTGVVMAAAPGEGMAAAGTASEAVIADAKPPAP